MARLWQSGAELNSVTSGVEFFTVSGSPTIDTTIKRSGAYSLKIGSLSSGAAKGVLHKFIGSTNAGPFWMRGYIYIVTLPSASNHIMSFNSSSGTAGTGDRGKITLEADGTLILRDSAGTAIGSPSSILSLNTWYCVELKMDRTAASGSRITEARLAPDDGSTPSVFATSSTQTDANNLACSWGGNLDLETQTTGEWYFDDMAVNDSSGSQQNSYPGQGKIIHLKPNASGDNNAWLKTAGGAGDSDNYTLVDEVTPNDATDYIQSTTLNDQDSYNMEASGIGASDTVNVVAAYWRLRNDTADTAIIAKIEIKKTSGGTITQGTGAAFNSTTWRMHSAAEPRNYTLVTYLDPDGAAWTQTTLDSMILGVKITTDGANSINVTALQASVDYTPSTGTNYTKDLDEVVTIADTIIRTPGKVLAETVMIADTIAKFQSRVFDEVVTIADTISNQSGKVLSEVITLADTISNLPGKVLSETIPIVDTISKVTARAFNEIVIIVDTILNQVSRAFSEVITIADTIATSVVKILTVSEVITIVDNFTRVINKVFSETITIVDTFVRNITKILSETVIISDIIATGQVYFKSLSETINLTETFETLFNKYGAEVKGFFRSILGMKPSGDIKPKDKPDGTIRAKDKPDLR